MESGPDDKGDTGDEESYRLLFPFAAAIGLLQIVPVEGETIFEAQFVAALYVVLFSSCDPADLFGA